MCSWIPREGDCVHIFWIDAGLCKAITDCVSWKTSNMLDADKTLLLSRGDELTVVYKCGRSLCVVGVNPED